MTAEDLLSMVIKQEQSVLASGVLSEKKEECLSDTALYELKADILRKARVEVDFNRVKIVENSKKSNINVLQQPVLEGFWVYFFFFSENYHELKWFEHYYFAKKYYDSLSAKDFVGRKMIIDTAKGVVLYE